MCLIHPPREEEGKRRVRREGERVGCTQSLMPISLEATDSGGSFSFFC